MVRNVREEEYTEDASKIGLRERRGIRLKFEWRRFRGAGGSGLSLRLVVQ